MTIGESTIVVSDGVIGSVESGSKTNVLAIVLGICIPIGVLSKFFINFSHYRYYRIRDLQEEGG